MSSPPKLHIAWCDAKAARHAVTRWHYSRSMPNSTVKLGVWENDQFIGAVLYGVGAGHATRGERYGLNPTHDIAELQRVALKPGHHTPTSRIVAITIRIIKRHSPNLKLLISFADQLGQNHHGGIYQAMNWIYAGTFKGDGGFIIHGRHHHTRSITSRGWKASLNWLRQNIDPNARKAPTLKHRYLYPLTPQLRRELQHLAQPYPKREV